MGKNVEIRPMPLWLSIFSFGIPAAFYTFTIYIAMPYLNKKGIPLIINFFIGMVSPLMLLLVASLLGYKIEGNQASWGSLKKRFRLNRMNTNTWIWTACLTLFWALIGSALLPISHWLVNIKFFTPPVFLPPVIDPRIEQNNILTSFMGISLPGNWWVAFLYLIFLFFNIIGEEFWWRGYILPRQELVHGKWTWIVHGTLWTLFHFFCRWNWIALFPACLALSYVAQKQKNTWQGIIAHFIINGAGLLPIIAGILA